METKQIVKHIDDGANFYIKFFGDAGHMEYHDNDCYSVVCPKAGEKGITFVFNIRLEGLTEDEQVKKIKEIKALNMPIWWRLQSSDELYKLIHEKDKMPVPSEPGDELYMAILPNEQIDSDGIRNDVTIDKVADKESFVIWAKIVNDMLNGGYPDIHAENHYHLCESGLLDCYICYYNDAPVAVASIMNNNGICSLEFVATVSECRQKGFAKVVCYKSMKDAFDKGAEIITLRAVNPGTRELYRSLGFKIYNHAI